MGIKNSSIQNVYKNFGPNVYKNIVKFNQLNLVRVVVMYAINDDNFLIKNL